MIYLASPYSHIDPEVRATRFRQVCGHAARLMRGGEQVYSPIVHSHPLAELGLPVHWEFWAEHNRRMLKSCDELVVLALPDWELSRGVLAELDIARGLGLPVRFDAYQEPDGE